MNARASILARIRALNLPEVPLPAMPAPVEGGDHLRSLLGAFERNLCTVARATAERIPEVIRELYPDAKEIFSTVPGIRGQVEYDLSAGPGALGNLDLTVVRAAFAVAENGAMWIRREDLDNPAACFIASNLVVVLDSTQVVPDMHAAYQKVQFEGPFGVFIAGPSRTADIEQSLVIGAHGPLTMAVVLVD